MSPGTVINMSDYRRSRSMPSRQDPLRFWIAMSLYAMGGCCFFVAAVPMVVGMMLWGVATDFDRGTR